MKIVAVVPGVTSGVAYFAQADCASIELPAFEALRYVERLVENGAVDLVVCEAITPRAGMRTWQPVEIESIGCLRYMCQKANLAFELHTPSAKRFATNQKLERLGWRNPSKDGYADDATRHILNTLVKHDLIDPASTA